MARRTTRVRRRWLLRAVGVAGVAGFAGCTGDDPDPDETNDDGDGSGDDGGGTGDDGGGTGDDGSGSGGDTDETGDDGDTPSGGDDRQVRVADDFDSYVSESRITQESPDGEVLVHEVYTEWDFANDRTYRRFKMGGEDEESGGVEFEYFVIEDTTYQIGPGGCRAIDGNLVENGQVGGQVADLQIPDAHDIETAENAEKVRTDTVDGEEVDVWVFDLGETMGLQEGEMTIHLSTETGHVVLADGRYETGHADNPGVVEFERRIHSIDEEFTIERPEECEE